MQTTATLYCPNCQSPNLESDRFCQQCRTLLPKNYLWAAGPGLKTYRAGDVLADRYLLKSDRVLLDTKPGLPVENQFAIPESAEPYLKLFPYRLHIPQVYGIIQFDQGQEEGILLLEPAPIGSWDLPKNSVEAGQPSTGVAVPFTTAWSRADPLRQLNWLWQIVQLWQPLSSQRVASSLLQPELLRVEGPLVRLLELRLDQGSEPTLAQLGEFWQGLGSVQAATASVGNLRYGFSKQGSSPPSAQVETPSAIATSLEQLCQQMVQGQFRTAEHLAEQLEEWLAIAGRSHSWQTEIATRTDKGPARQHNEDACYPPDGTIATNPPLAVTIVCDGVGGHAGGAIASSLATEVLLQHVQSLDVEALDSKALMAELETAACVANDQISQRNDSEQRQDRQRMGTTLVMALARAHEMYIAHVGDSRAYWITPAGCYQVTLDDDVASREVRLGYTLYREALTQPTSGSLVQALGMGSSAILRPTVQRFILDEDCLFLLCSDGLSDRDRVEESWEAEILPILDGKINLATASQRLIELANQKNGHDNVTVSLIHCQVAPVDVEEVPSEAPASARFESPVAKFPLPDSDAGLAKTQVFQPDRRSVTKPLLAFLLLSSVGGLLALLLPSFLRLRPLTDNSPVPENPSPSPVSSVPSVVPAQTITVGSQLQVNPAVTGNPGKPISTVLLSQPDKPEGTKGVLLTGSTLQVLAKQTLPNQGSWLRVKVCSAPLTSPSLETSTQAPKTASSTGPGQGSSPATPLLPGTTGWIQEADITPVATVLKPDRSSSCAAGAS